MKAWVEIIVSCAQPCTESNNIVYNVSTINHSAAGVWSVTLSPARTDASYAVIVMSRTATYFCVAASQTNTTVGVSCKDNAGTDHDNPWSMILVDNT